MEEDDLTQPLPSATEYGVTKQEAVVLPQMALPDRKQQADYWDIETAETMPTMPSPELAELLARRKRLALEETQRLQAITVAPEPKKGDAAPTTASANSAAEKTASASRRLLRRKRRVPVLLQMSIVECGAACLAMILSYYGRATTVAELRERCGVGRDGLSALNLVKAARSYGLRVRAVSLEENDLRFVTLPAIVHWEFNHFIVVER